jgi:hypothetical protein
MIPPSQIRVLWTAAVGVPLLFVAIAVLQTKIDVASRAVNEENSELLLRSGAAVRRMSLGYDSLAADIYWTRAVQYYGGRAGVSGANFQELFPLLDIATALDPKLIVAYRFGAIFLSEPPAQGAGRTDLAIELVKHGMAENPANWYLPSDLGFLYYWRLKDYPAAAQAYLEGSKIPDAPSWMRIMAALVAQRGGSIETSRMIWTQIYNSTQDKNVRDRALKTLRGLRALEDEQTLDGLAQQYKNRFRHFPASSADLRDAGLIRGNPVDPQGYPYVFGPDGRSRLDPQSPIVIPPGLQLPGEASK